MKNIKIPHHVGTVPKSYKRLEKIVRMYPANKFDTLNANTTFITMSEEDKGALRIK
jgi:hypothetical protein